MESIARPLRRLHEDAAWFTRATDVKVLHVTTEASLRADALKVIAAQEHHADNRALFLRFDDPMSGADLGWLARAQRLREMWDEKAAALQPAGIMLAPLGQVEVEPSAEGAVAFGAALMTAVRRLAPPLEGLVVVLAPARVEDGAGFARTLTSLVTSAHLPDVRWIVVETDGDAVGPLLPLLAVPAMASACTVDEQAQGEDLGAGAGGGGGGNRAPSAAIDAANLVRPWRAPGAMPAAIAAPARPGSSRVPSEEALRESGLLPPVLAGGAETLKTLVMSAALALREGRTVDAVTSQSRAAALCAEMGAPREQVLNLHVLASYVLAATQRTKARDIYRAAATIARQHAAPDLEAQSELALALLAALDNLPAEAATHYSAAARLAETAGIIPLAIESWRLAGQLALDAGLESSAVECWKKAITLADPLDPALAKETTAATTALALAALCRRHCLDAQAAELEERARRLEKEG